MEIMDHVSLLLRKRLRGFHVAGVEGTSGGARVWSAERRGPMSALRGLMQRSMSAFRGPVRARCPRLCAGGLHCYSKRATKKTKCPRFCASSGPMSADSGPRGGDVFRFGPRKAAQCPQFWAPCVLTRACTYEYMCVTIPERNPNQNLFWCYGALLGPFF